MIFNFKRKMTRISRRQYRRDIITLEEYETIQKTLEDDVATAKWQAEIERQLSPPWTGVGDLDWAAIWLWLQEHWIDILRVLLTLLPFIILETGPEVDPEVEPESENIDEN